MGTSTGPKREKSRKPYEKPTATRLTSEEAKLKLVDHASRGDQGAKDILEMMFPEEAKKLSTGKKKPA
jgi:hypothetical protein